MLKKVNKQILLFISSVVFTVSASAANQVVVPSQHKFKVSEGEVIEFSLNYPSSSPSNTTGLGVQVYYDSKKITLKAVSDVFKKDLIAVSEDINDTNNDDKNDQTDKKINIAWASLNGDWPAMEARDTQLFKVSFIPTKKFNSTTIIGFTGNASAKNTFSATPITISSTKVTSSTIEMPVNTTSKTPSTSDNPTTDTGKSLSSKSASGSVNLLLILLFVGLGIVRLSAVRKFNISTYPFKL